MYRISYRTVHSAQMFCMDIEAVSMDRVALPGLPRQILELHSSSSGSRLAAKLNEVPHDRCADCEMAKINTGYNSSTGWKQLTLFRQIHIPPPPLTAVGGIGIGGGC